MSQGSFSKGKDNYAAISKSERNEYCKNMLKVASSHLSPPYCFKKSFPSQGKLEYQGYQLHYYAHEQTQHPQAIMLYTHGLDGHAGYAGYFMMKAAELNPGLNVFGLDQMNFGKSEGPCRGQVYSASDSVRQTHAFLEMIMSRYKNKPKVYLSGDCYGAAVNFKMALDEPERFAGLVMLAPCLRVHPVKWPWMKILARILGWLTPRWKCFVRGLGQSSRYTLPEDPLAYTGKAVPRSIRTTLLNQDEISQRFGELTTPYIVFQAGIDKLVDAFAPLDLEEQSPSHDKTTIYCQDAWHFLCEQPQIQEIAEITAAWLKDRI